MGNILYEAVVLDDNDSYERNMKEKEYLDYIEEHIFLVNKCYGMYMLPLLKANNISTLISDEELKNAITEVGKYIKTHDASKFSDSEFDGYREKYYPTTRELNGDLSYKSNLEERYQECWKHHYETNAHHPEHWLNHEDNTCNDMILEAIVEMICDWEAMSLKFGTSTLKWYENDAKDEKRCFSPKTKEIVEDLLYNVIHNSVSNSPTENV